MDNKSSLVYPANFSSPEQDSVTMDVHSKEAESQCTNEDPESLVLKTKDSNCCVPTAVHHRSPCPQCHVAEDKETRPKSNEGSLRNNKVVESYCHTQYFPKSDYQPPLEAQNQKAVFDLKSKAEVPSSSTFLQATLNGINVLAGIGALSTPYALSHGGWLALLFLGAFAMICLYTGILLRRCLDSHSAMKTYPDIGQAAFGWKGGALIALLLYMELYCTAVEYLILEGDHLASLRSMSSIKIGSWTLTQQQFYVIVSALCVMPTMWVRNLRLLSYLSAGGVFASVAIVASVGYVGVFDGVGFHASGSLVHGTGLPVAMGVFAFCYSGHSLFPSIYGSMKFKTDFSKVLAVCFSSVTILYAAIAIMGYTMFGDAVDSQVTLDLPKEHLSSRIAIWIMLVTPFAKFSLTLTPLAVALEEQLPWSRKSPQFLLWGTVIRTALVFSTAAVALLVPFFGYIMALVGSFLSMSTAIILPCACYLKIFGAQGFVPRGEILTLVAIIAFGTVAAVLGTFSAVEGIVKSFFHHKQVQGAA